MAAIGRGNSVRLDAIRVAHFVAIGQQVRAGTRFGVNAIQPVSDVRDSTVAQSVEVLFGRGNRSVGN